MRILHTSDWHLGRSLYGKKRYEEFESFLDWLVDVIVNESIDVLLIAGDVFDTGTPSNRAQGLYYQFLGRVSLTNCRHIIVIAGNHDSPSFLNAPKEILKALNVYIVGSVTESIEDEVIVLSHNNKPEAIVCAVPYLRDKDVRTAEPGETIDDKNIKLIKGIEEHYSDVCLIAEKKRAELNTPNIPIIAMGHLFTAGGKTVDGDGVRELYVGSLTHVHTDLFPVTFDYFALGHLHIPQVVNKKQHIRYCGSPLPIGYGEANQEKQIIVVEFEKNTPIIKEIKVPTFQELIRITGSEEEIITKIEELKKKKSQAWLEIEYTGVNVLPNLRQIIDEGLIDSTLEVRRIKNRQITDRVSIAMDDDETLADLSLEEVFTRCLDAYKVPAEERIKLTASYNEIVKKYQEEDRNAE